MKLIFDVTSCKNCPLLDRADYAGWCDDAEAWVYRGDGAECIDDRCPYKNEHIVFYE